MLRLAELALFLAPFAAIVVWRVLSAAGGPSPRLLASLAGAICILAAVLFWTAARDRAPPGGRYVPAHLENGQIVPAQNVPQ